MNARATTERETALDVVTAAPAVEAKVDVEAAQPALRVADAVVQAKLSVGPANDPYEREADDVADRVVKSLGGRTPDAGADRSTDGPARVQRATGQSTPEIGDGDGSGDPESRKPGADTSSMIGGRIGRVSRPPRAFGTTGPVAGAARIAPTADALRSVVDPSELSTHAEPRVQRQVFATVIDPVINQVHPMMSRPLVEMLMEILQKLMGTYLVAPGSSAWSAPGGVAEDEEVLQMKSATSDSARSQKRKKPSKGDKKARLKSDIEDVKGAVTHDALSQVKAILESSQGDAKGSKPSGKGAKGEKTEKGVKGEKGHDAKGEEKAGEDIKPADLKKSLMDHFHHIEENLLAGPEYDVDSSVLADKTNKSKKPGGSSKKKASDENHARHGDAKSGHGAGLVEKPSTAKQAFAASDKKKKPTTKKNERGSKKPGKRVKKP